MKTYLTKQLVPTLCLGLIFIANSQALTTKDGVDMERRWQSFMQAPDKTKAAREFPYANCFRQAALAHHVPEILLLAVARGESNFEADAISHANAYGLMQILWPGTARHLGITQQADLFDPCTNVDAGARYLRELLEKYNNNLHRSLAAYNYGPSRIPVSGGSIPDGANWYSGYIYRHLGYIQQAAATSDADNHNKAGEFPVIHFLRPYRAAAFVLHLQPRLGEIRLDWFRRPQGGFDVVMLYNDRGELESGLKLLEAQGLLQPSGNPAGIKI